MTASILGGLAYMPSEWALVALKSMFSNFSLSAPELNWPTSGSKLSVELWPRYGNIEPDMRITLKDDNGPAYKLLVEVKWDSPFHENQALTQWRLLKDLAAIHVLLVRRPEVAEQHVTACDPGQQEQQWRSNLRILTWNQVARNLTQLKRELSLEEEWSPLRAWSADASKTLDRFGEHCFQGIYECPELNEIPSMKSPVFYADFSQILWPQILMDDIQHWTPTQK